MMGPKPRDALERFLAKALIVESGCWEWQAARNRKGYGTFYGRDRSRLLAHRFAYEEYKHAVPAGMFVLHKCDNRRCVNPEHLFLGTLLDNNEDMRVKGRAASGERHASRTHPERVARGEKLSDLKEDDVRDIRKRARMGHNQGRIAKEYGITQQLVSCIKLGRAWAWLD